MKKQIYERYDKNSIASLKRAVFEGRIIVVVSEGEARRAVDFLLSQPILGVDTETRPSFRKGSNHKVSLLQVATKDICFLFRLNHLGLNADIGDKTTLLGTKQIARTTYVEILHSDIKP